MRIGRLRSGVHGAGTVRHGGDNLLSEVHLGRIGREHGLGNRDLRGVQRPGAEAAHQEGIAELRLAGGRIGEIAERPVKRLDTGGGAGIDHFADGVVPEVLLVERPLGVAVAAAVGQRRDSPKNGRSRLYLRLLWRGKSKRQRSESTEDATTDPY